MIRLRSPARVKIMAKCMSSMPMARTEGIGKRKEDDETRGIRWWARLRLNQ